MFKTPTIALVSAVLFALAGCSSSGAAAGDATLTEFYKQFPYQDTFDYAMKYTGGDAAKLNTWCLGMTPVLVKAGDDKVVRMNNDTYYKMAFMLLDQGPVTLGSSNPSQERFSSFQLMDDRNVNFRNVIHPDGDYTLYYGDKPEGIKGEAIEVPSELMVVIVRVEVKSMSDAGDTDAAKKVFAGITIKGPTIAVFPKLDLLSGFEPAVREEAMKRIDECFETTPFTQLVPEGGNLPGKVSYLQLAAGTKGGWGGPVTKHSAYDTIFAGADGEPLDGSRGTYTITTEAPEVDAFWSLTVYDTERGGFLHPNPDNRYHINNTSAVKNEDGTYTFTFKTKCEPGDKNCLAVPAGKFDIAARYYLPKAPIRSGKWVLPKAVLQKN